MKALFDALRNVLYGAYMYETPEDMARRMDDLRAVTAHVDGAQYARVVNLLAAVGGLCDNDSAASVVGGADTNTQGEGGNGGSMGAGGRW